MQFKNSNHRYGVISLLLHWLIAFTVFGLFGLGLYMVELTYYDRFYKSSVHWHKSIGLILFAVLLLRVFWRFYSKPPAMLAANWQSFAAHAVHVLLYALPLLLCVTGFMIATADGRAIEVFSWFSVPALPVAFSYQEEVAGIVHEYAAWTLIAVVVLHALAAIKHHVIDRDATLLRIFGITPNIPNEVNNEND